MDHNNILIPFVVCLLSSSILYLTRAMRSSLLPSAALARKGKDKYKRVELIQDLKTGRYKRRREYQKQQTELKKRQPRSLLVLKKMINSNTETTLEYETRLLYKAKQAHIHRLLHAEEAIQSDLGRRMTRFFQDTEQFIKDREEANIYVTEVPDGYTVNAKLPTLKLAKKKHAKAKADF